MSSGRTAHFAEIGSLLRSPTTARRAMASIVAAAPSLVPGTRCASLTVIDRHPVTDASTGAARELDEHQYAERSGPCLHAATTGELQRVSEGTFAQKWPALARHARAHGIGSMLSVPLAVHGAPKASLNIYGADQDFDVGDEETCRVLATLAGTALLVAERESTAGDRRDEEPWLGSVGHPRKRFPLRRPASLVLRCPRCHVDVVLSEPALELLQRSRLACPSLSCRYVFRRGW